MVVVSKADLQRCVLILCIAVGGVLPLRAQFIERLPSEQPPQPNPTIHEYQFWQSSNVAPSNTPVIEPDKQPIGSHKSTVLAAGLSLILPGLGEYYVGDDIWHGIVLTAIEGGLWYGRLHYISRGDDSLVAFHAWADSLWSSQKYSDSLSKLLAISHHDPIADGNNFSQINRGEDTLDYYNFPNFTHRLPAKGSQQYYELISKYDQFAWGWRDGNLQSAKASPEAERHSQMRADMNYQYEVADYFLWGMLVNRILSAIDAAILAKNHNAAIRLQGDLIQRPFPNGQLGYVPTAKLRWTF